MTTMATPLIGASSVCEITWSNIDWNQVEKHIRRLQMRIAKAIRDNRWGKAKALQRLLTHSFYGKLWAVRRVVRNKGGKTPGVDGVVWTSSKQKMKAALSLSNKGYKAKPLKRIYIPKKDGRKRPLSIPSMSCRAMQALHLLSLEPIAEQTADPNSYGFRQKRSTADAIEQCFNALAKKRSAQFVLECDIKSCFDKINHQWLMDNIPMNKKILSKWLESGFIENDQLHKIESGTPQGGLASPVMMNLTLDGMEQSIKKAAKLKYRVHFIRYADDWVVTGPSKEILEERVLPEIRVFLKSRGLELSNTKTRIVHTESGFDFLGFNIRKYNGKLIIKPSKDSIKSILSKVRRLIKINASSNTENLIRQLNPILRGWANYYKSCSAKKAFSYIDHQVYKALWAWARRRHKNKGAAWVFSKYFRVKASMKWAFFSKIKKKTGEFEFLNLIFMNMIPIIRHIKIKADANPYDTKFASYFKIRTG